MYESCKNVKFGSFNSRALDFLGAGAQDFKEWFAFIGQKAGVNLPGSPYGIKFSLTAPASSGMKPMNVSTSSCSDDTLGRSCSIMIGSLEAICVDFVLAILYIILVSLCLGGGFHRIKDATKHSTEKLAQLSKVQGYLANFYRKYGIWVARHPILVLCLVLLLCVGLIRFKVGTRPDKVAWFHINCYLIVCCSYG